MNKPELKTTLAACRFDPWNLAGPANRFRRQELMKLITGERKPIAACGVNALTAEICRALDIDQSRHTMAAIPDEIRNTLEA